MQQFRQKEIPDDIPVYRSAPRTSRSGSAVSSRASGTVASNGEARRLIQQGGVKLNGEKVVNADLEIRPDRRVDCAGGQATFCSGYFSALKMRNSCLDRAG